MSPCVMEADIAGSIRETVDAATSERLAAEFITLIDGAAPEDFRDIEGRILSKVYGLAIELEPAFRVLMYARHRLLGDDCPRSLLPAVRRDAGAPA